MIWYAYINTSQYFGFFRISSKFKYRTAYDTNRDLYKYKFVQSISATNNFVLVIFIRKGDNDNF